MIPPAQPKAKRLLQTLSSSSKIGVQVMWVVTLIILPLLFPNIITIEHHIILVILLIIQLTTSILYEVMTYIYRQRGKDTGWIVKLQLLSSIVGLPVFLFLFGRNNGPFFVLYLLTIMESALNLTPTFLNIVVGIAVTAIVSEFFYLIFIHEITFSLYTALQLLIRIISLFFMKAYGSSLSERIIAEERERKKVEKTAAELAEATKQIQETNKKLEYVDKLKDEFVSLVSHELRTPLAAIKSYTWMVVNSKAGAITPKATEYLNRVYISTERLIHLVNEMLDVSRIESGRVTINKAPLDMAKLLLDVQNELQARATESQINLTISKDGSIPIVQADAEKIRQVLENLVGNSLKFTPKNGSITMGVRQAGGFLEIYVTDTGQGIDAADIPRLFQKFGRIDNVTTSTPVNSTGLGLYICKQYVELHGGKIWVESKPDKGSTFTFTLPIQHP